VGDEVVGRSIDVDATVALEGAEEGDYRDLQIEQVNPS
jgi:hypothetical protein